MLAVEKSLVVPWTPELIHWRTGSSTDKIILPPQGPPNIRRSILRVCHFYRRFPIFIRAPPTFLLWHMRTKSASSINYQAALSAVRWIVRMHAHVQQPSPGLFGGGAFIAPTPHPPARPVPLPVILYYASPVSGGTLSVMPLVELPRRATGLLCPCRCTVLIGTGSTTEAAKHIRVALICTLWDCSPQVLPTSGQPTTKVVFSVWMNSQIHCQRTGMYGSVSVTPMV